MSGPEILTLHPQVFLSHREDDCFVCGGSVAVRRQRVTGASLEESATWYLRRERCGACGAVEEWVEEAKR